MTKGEGYYFSSSQHLASKALSLVGANIFNHYKICFYLIKVHNNRNVLIYCLIHRTTQSQVNPRPIDIVEN